MRYVHAARDAGLRRAVVSSSTNCRDVLRRRRHRGPVREPSIDGVVAEREHLKGKPAPDTFLAGARALGVAAGQAAVFEDALAGVEAGRAGRFRRAWSASTASGRPMRCASTAPTSSSRDLAELLRHAVIEHRAFPVEPWALRETELDLDVLAQTESRVRARQRAHRAAREPRRGRAARPAGHLSRTASTRCARCPTPRPATAARRPARRWSTSPTARSSACWSTTSRSTCATASCAATSACSTCAPACCGARAEWRSPAGRRGAGQLDAPGLVRAARGRRDPLRGRGARRRSAGGRAVGARGQRADADAASDDPRAAAALGAPLRVREFDAHDDRAPCSCTSTPQSGLRMAAGDGSHRRRAAEAPRRPARAPRTSARVMVTADLAPGQAAARRQAARLRVVGASAPRRRCATRSRRRWREARHTGWDGLLAGQRELSRRLLGARRRRDRGRRRAPAGGALRRCSTCCRRARGPSGARSPPRG